MSLVHWDKSVLTFHLKEILEDPQGNDAAALLGVGAIAFGTLAVPALIKFGRPAIKTAIKATLPRDDRYSIASPPDQICDRQVEAKFPKSSTHPYSTARK